MSGAGASIMASEAEKESSVKSELDERSNSSDSLAIDNQQLIEDLANDYSSYMNFDMTKEQNKFSESIEDMLTKLDEFCGLVDMIRSDTSLCLTKTVPEIRSKCAEMENIFEKIDRLEAFVAVVKQSVNKMDDCVGKAEDDFSSLGGIMKKITSIVSPKRQDPEKRSKQTVFVPPEIFHTGNYLGPTSATAKPATSAGAAAAAEAAT